MKTNELKDISLEKASSNRKTSFSIALGFFFSSTDRFIVDVLSVRCVDF